MARLEVRYLSYTFSCFLFFFAMAGWVFLFFPNQHYNPNGWGVLIKYFFYGLVLVSLLSTFMFKGCVDLRLAIFYWLWIYLLVIALLVGADIKVLSLYLLPSLLFIFPVHKLSFNINLFLRLVVFMAVLGAIFEFFYLGGFDRFSPNGYRAVSIYINPNNLGVCMVLISILSYYAKGERLNFSLMFGVVFLIVLSGSKTALVIYLIFLILVFVPRIKAVYTLLLMPFAFVFSIFGIYLSGNRYTIDSFVARMSQISNSWSLIKESPFFPFLIAGRETYYVDNAFLQLWLDVGLLPFILLISFFAFSIISVRQYYLFYLACFLAALSTNIFYIWPIAYLFWGVSSYFLRINKVGIGCDR